MASTITAKLNTGATIPSLGFGTWQDKDAQEQAVAEALKAGYKHVRVTQSLNTGRIVDHHVSER